MSEISKRWDVLTTYNGREAVIWDGDPSNYTGYPSSDAAIAAARRMPGLVGKRWAVARGDLSEIAHVNEVPTE